MATKKGNEPVEQAAFDALEKALQIDFDETAKPKAASQPASNYARSGEGRSARSMSSESASEARPDFARELGPEPAPKSPYLAPANDPSGRTSSSLLRSLDTRAGRSVIRSAMLFASVWIVISIALGYLALSTPKAGAENVASTITSPGFLTLAGIVIIPVLLIIGFGLILGRAQEMRSAARSMAEVALRLSEPETMASQRIMTIGQAVRREVSAMSEGIERTIARATELETLVHSEVNALERSYSENEVRVRTLVNELSAEREAIINHSERLRSSISGAHDSLASDMRGAAESLTAQMAITGEAFASMIDTRAALLMEKSETAASTIGTMLATQSDTLLSTLNSAGFALANEFDTRLEELSFALTNRGNELLSQFETRASTLDQNTTKLNAALAERTRQLNETLISRTQEINDSLAVGRARSSPGSTT